MNALRAGNFYQLGGTLQRDAPSYVTRRADEELYRGLGQGRFCYVLTSRQMGKSSLMVRTAARLRAQRCAVAVLDLTSIGQNLSVEQWYEGLLSELGKQLRLEDELEDFWFEHEHVAPLRRWMRALRELVLPRCAGPLVIFIDEIDAVRSLPFSTDEFFAGIRELYNQRATDPALGRLAFCLLGVAAPTDLISDTRTTPFNIGQRVELRDFTEAEAVPLAQGLGRAEKPSRAILRRVLYWTGGHPYLTQLLCQTIATAEQVRDSSGVDRVCAELFFTPHARERDPNLLFVRDRLLGSEAELVSLLELYTRVQQGAPVPDDETNPLISVLRLSGIVQMEKGRLGLRNRIYARVFDREWIAAHMPNAELERQRKAYRRGLWRATAIATVIILLLGGSILIALRALNRAEASERNVRQLLYAARMNLAGQAWENGNITVVTDLLRLADEPDLRGFEWEHLWLLTHAERHSFEMPDDVWATAFSPDGQTLAAGSNDGTVKLWRVRDGQLLRVLPHAHHGSVNALAFLPESRVLVTAGDDKRVVLWEAASGAELAQLPGHENEVHSVIVAPRRQWIVTGSEEDGEVKFWSQSSRQLLARFQTTEQTIVTMALSPDEKTLVLGSRLGGIELWEVEDVTRPRRRAALNTALDGTPISALAFSPDGQWLAASRADGKFKLWTSAGKPAPFAFGASATALAFSPDGRWLVTAQPDKSVTLWESATRRAVETFKGQRGLIRAIAFAPDSAAFATASQDHSVKLWAVQQAKAQTLLATQLGKVQALAFAPQFGPLAGQLAVAGGTSVQSWDTTRRQQLLQWPAHAFAVTALAFAPDGQSLATTGEDGALKLWRAASGQLLRTFDPRADELPALAFSPDGKLLAASAKKPSGEKGIRLIYLWETATGRELARLSGHTEVVRALAFAPDGRTLASGSEVGLLKLWHVAERREQAALRIQPGSLAINALAYAPDGQTLAAASEDGMVHLFDSASGAERLPLKGHAEAVLAVAFSPDGKRLATGSQDRTVKLWDAVHGQELTTFKPHNTAVSTVAFSATGRMLAAGGADGSVTLWLASPPPSSQAAQSP